MAAKAIDVLAFIECVKLKPFLYDRFDEEYKDSEKRQRTWMEIADMFNLGDAKEAYKKWKYFKDHYFAEKKKMNDRGVDESDPGDFKKWAYYDALKWTDNFLEKRTNTPRRVVKRPRVKTAPHCTATTPTMVVDGSVGATLENCVSSLVNALGTNQPTIYSTHSQSEKENDSFTYRSLKNVFNPVVHVTKVEPMSDDDHHQLQQQFQQALTASTEEELFGRLVTRDLARLPEHLRPLARLKIQELLYHFSINHIPELR